MNLFKIEANYIDILNKEIYPTGITIANGHCEHDKNYCNIRRVYIARIYWCAYTYRTFFSYSIKLCAFGSLT